MPRTIALTYYPWITQSLSGPDLAKAVASFGQILERAISSKLGESIQVTVPPEMDVSAQIADIMIPPLATGSAKIALMNPLGYAYAHSLAPAVEALAVVRRKIGTSPAGPTYRAQIYTNVLSGVTTLSEARKRTVVFGSPQSTSNFLVPAHMLLRAGLNPMSSFTQVVFAGGHKTAAKAVYEVRADIGAGHDGVIDDLAAEIGYGNAHDRLVRLAWSDPIPSDPFVTHTDDVQLKQMIIAALSDCCPTNSAQAPGNQAVNAFWNTVEGFEQSSPSAYDSLLDFVADLSLDPRTLLQAW